MIYFTADTHFSHANILKYSNRPFRNVNEMDEAILFNINELVKEADTLYILGDFAFGSTNLYLNRINCKNIIRIKGSHDRDISQPYMLVIEPEGLLDEYGNQRSISLCHYAMRTWDKSHYASWHLYGHSHCNLEPYGLSFDVGVDCWDYKPISLLQVAEKMRTLKPIVDYRKENKHG